MKVLKLNFLLIGFIGVFGISTKIAHAQCSSPSGATGEIIYNSSENAFQGCASSGWNALSDDPSAPTGSCVSPTGSVGEIIYNSTYGYFQGCTENNWMRLTHAPGLGGPTSTGLVAYWKLDETSGTTASDNVGSSNGTMQSSMTGANATTSGKYSTALEFDGPNTSNEILVNSNATIDNIFDGGGTITLWVNARSATGGNNGDLIYKTSNGGTVPEGYDISFYGYSGANSRIMFRHAWSSSSSARAEWYTNNELPEDEWAHLAVVFDSSSSSNVPTFYMNGEVAAYSEYLNTGSGGSEDDSGVNMYIGWEVDGPMDDVRYYNRELTAAEVLQMYSATSPDAGASGCSSPAGETGEVIYNSTSNVFQGCTPDGWMTLE